MVLPQLLPRLNKFYQFDMPKSNGRNPVPLKNKFYRDTACNYGIYLDTIEKQKF